MQGVITSWNTAAERMFGYSPEEIIGQSVLKIIPEELQKDEPATLSRVAVGERIEHFQTTRLHKNGSRVEVSLSVSPIRNHEGDVVGAAKIARDITQQRLDERSTRQLAAIVDSSDDAIVSKDLNGVITSWNRAAERIFGYSAHEIIGRNVLTIIPPELYSDETMILGKIRAGDRIEHFETIRLHKNGARIPISLSISPIRDSQGKIVGAAKIARDISQQVTDQQAALRYAALVESSEDAIITKDLNGVITSWNPAAQRIFGYTPHEIIGRNILTIIPKELQSDEPVILAKIRAGERIEHFQTVRLHKNGTRLDVSLTVSPVRDGGRIVGAAKIVRDVTRQRKMESALHTSERLASVGRLAATIAHEINNPLEAVTNFIYLSRMDPNLPANVAEYLKIADQELNRVALVAQQTLGFYRDNTRPVMVSVADSVNDVLTIFSGKIRYKSISLERRFAPDLRFQTLLGQLKQILLNLVGNAIDASRPDGRLVISAHVHTHLGDRRVLALTVADNGSGIAEWDRNKIFEPFFTTKKDVGTGLGLWITRDLVERKGGKIRFRTRTGTHSGTCMTVFLPEDTPAVRDITGQDSSRPLQHSSDFVIRG